MEVRTETRGGMRITWHQTLEMDDGIVIPPGWTLALTVRGKDDEYAGELSEFAKTFHDGTRGTGGMTHGDPINRPRDVFGGTVTLNGGGAYRPYLLVPVIPSASSS
jgi:uncharacterized protein